MYSSFEDKIYDNIVVYNDLGKDEMLHPLFEEDCKIKEPFCYDYAYSPTRVSKELFDDFAIMRNNIRAFIRLLRRIQYANLSELLV